MNTGTIENLFSLCTAAFEICARLSLNLNQTSKIKVVFKLAIKSKMGSFNGKEHLIKVNLIFFPSDVGNSRHNGSSIYRWLEYAKRANIQWMSYTKTVEASGALCNVILIIFWWFTLCCIMLASQLQRFSPSTNSKVPCQSIKNTIVVRLV